MTHDMNAARVAANGGARPDPQGRRAAASVTSARETGRHDGTAMTMGRGGTRPGGHPGAGAIAELTTTDPTTDFHDLVRRAHRLGPRVVGEILLRLVPDRGALLRELRRYDGLDPAVVEAVGARDWLDPRALVREVRP